VLKALLPHIEYTLQSFSLGLSYSLTNDDVFDFLSKLPNLREIRLQYYWVGSFLVKRIINSSGNNSNLNMPPVSPDSLLSDPSP